MGFLGVYGSVRNDPKKKWRISLDPVELSFANRHAERGRIQQKKPEHMRSLVPSVA